MLAQWSPTIPSVAAEHKSSLSFVNHLSAYITCSMLYPVSATPGSPLVRLLCWRQTSSRSTWDKKTAQTTQLVRLSKHFLSETIISSQLLGCSSFLIFFFHSSPYFGTSLTAGRAGLTLIKPDTPAAGWQQWLRCQRELRSHPWVITYTANNASLTTWDSLSRTERHLSPGCLWTSYPIQLNVVSQD